MPLSVEQGRVWGDNGVGFIVQSPEHPEVVTFFYQCS